MRSMLRAAPLFLAGLALAACSKGEQATPDSSASAAAATATPAPAPAAAVEGQGDKAFLEQMSDHHEGMVQMAYTTRGKISDPETRKDADKLHEKQSAERDTMVAMLKRDFNDSYTPKAPPGNQAMVDSLDKLRGRFLAKDFYEMTAAHHRDGIAMIDHFMPSLKNAKVKAMATKMRADQEQEIAEFMAKAPKKGPIDPRASGEAH